MAKAPNENGSDGEERKLGEQTGLDFEKFLNLFVVSSTNTTDKEKRWNLNFNSTNYPSSPSCKRCVLDVAYSIWMCSVETKVLSTPPGKYGRKAET